MAIRHHVVDTLHRMGVCHKDHVSYIHVVDKYEQMQKEEHHTFLMDGERVVQ